VLKVLRPRCVVYEDVIKELQDAFMEEGTKQLFHQALECGQSIGETERHHNELKVPVMRLEHCLLYIVRVDTHLVVASAHIKLGEEARAARR